MRFSQSARRHRIGRSHVLWIVRRSTPTVVTAEGALDRWVWLATDDRGLVLEVVALDLPDYLLVIHVMPYALRRRR